MPLVEYPFSDDWSEVGWSPPCAVPAVPFLCEDPCGDSVLLQAGPDLLNNNEAVPAQDAWRRKPVKCWAGEDIFWWLDHEARVLKVVCTDLQGDRFCRFDGITLAEMAEAEFRSISEPFGEYLYRSLRQMLSSENSKLSSVCEPSYTELKTSSKFHIKSINEEKEQIDDAPTFFMEDDPCAKEKDEDYPYKRKKQGRPKLAKKKKKPEKKLGRLWEFIRDLLKNREYCPKIICWENHDEGTFRFVRSDEVAKLWGSKKDNKEMNYEKLSRAMRYYYRSQVLQPVLGRRLVYKFGPAAEGWRVDNPNFKN